MPSPYNIPLYCVVCKSQFLANKAQVKKGRRFCSLHCAAFRNRNRTGTGDEFFCIKCAKNLVKRENRSCQECVSPILFGGKRGPGPSPVPLEKWLVENSKGSRPNIKRRLFLEKLIENKCYICSMEPTWQGKPLIMVLDHINGNPRDYRLNNLRLLCPNCNSQTDTFAGKNARRERTRS